MRVVSVWLLSILAFVLMTPVHAEPSIAPGLTLEAFGKQVFSDRRFSASGQTSCRSCHKPEFGFSDHRAVSIKDDGTATALSTPALFNMKQKIGFFSLHPVFSLKAAVERCFKRNQNIDETDIYGVLERDAGLSRFAIHNFGRASADVVYQSVAAYLKTIQTSNSRYDRYRQGELSALTYSEQSGMVLFEQKGCIYCHSGREMGGMAYSNSIDTHVNRDVQVLRLRNLSLTAPYFSDGSAQTLSEAIYRMSKRYSATPVSQSDLEKIRLFLLSNESSISDFEGPVRYENER
ncbi:cytochrome c peroxidase [Oceanospirillum linum]|nr:cytochrome c peroxidase [Oleiphilus messinensis]SMP13121.1 cytochrome c peroxidase [Oceanospirillum linum]